jgi:uncharacterized protein
MKFIADAMLGRLAKWLRFLGFDVLYYRDIDDRHVIKISREEERIILTRDTALLKHKGLRETIFIQSNKVVDQLVELKDKLNFMEAAPRGRCVLCNGTLIKIARREEVRSLVPDFVYYNFQDFTVCESCGKIYWEGSHYKKFREKIRELVKVRHEK